MIINDMVGEILNQDGRDFYFIFILFFCRSILLAKRSLQHSIIVIDIYVRAKVG